MSPPKRFPVDLEAASSLVELGLTELEASVYVFLLESGPATGYQVAKEIGRPVANAYKALYSMEEKGAVLVEEGETRRCLAVAPKELLSRLEREFKDRKRSAAQALSGAKAEKRDEAVYRLTSASQVVERAVAMLRRAKRHAFVEAFPRPIELIRPSLERAVGRDVHVLVEAYEPLELEGASVALHPSRVDVLGMLPGELLTVAVDGEEALHAMIDAEGDAVSFATWTANRHLACQAYLAGVNNVALSDLMVGLEDGLGNRALTERVRRYDPMRLRNTLGFERISAAALAEETT